ncbi:hypothetical protein [Kitasatospora sp. NPDC094011]|uniref:hypothetical protein n=1 Tax=Kitasatospora sp. NPDC094011 TaxID=3364090 RepID=UPI0037F48643
MNPAELATTVPALLTLPIAFLTALWARRSGERAADAALDAGLRQARAAVEAARLQRLGEDESRRRDALTDASAAFLRAADALAATVRGLPEAAHERRRTRLADRALAVETGYGPLELLAPPILRSRAHALLGHCQELARVAVDRAVLRSAVAALENGWCLHPDAEFCEHPQHTSAAVARDLLVDWSGKDAEQRWQERDLLAFCLRESRCLSEEETARVLALADRLPAGWSQLIGGYFRDPLLERFTELRGLLVEAARSTQARVGSVPGQDPP